MLRPERLREPRDILVGLRLLLAQTLDRLRSQRLADRVEMAALCHAVDLGELRLGVGGLGASVAQRPREVRHLLLVGAQTARVDDVVGDLVGLGLVLRRLDLRRERGELVLHVGRVAARRADARRDLVVDIGLGEIVGDVGGELRAAGQHLDADHIGALGPLDRDRILECLQIDLLGRGRRRRMQQALQQAALRAVELGHVLEVRHLADALQHGLRGEQRDLAVHRARVGHVAGLKRVVADGLAEPRVDQHRRRGEIARRRDDHVDDAADEKCQQRREDRQLAPPQDREQARRGARRGRSGVGVVLGPSTRFLVAGVDVAKGHAKGLPRAARHARAGGRRPSAGRGGRAQPSGRRSSSSSTSSPRRSPEWRSRSE